MKTTPTVRKNSGGPAHGAEPKKRRWNVSAPKIAVREKRMPSDHEIDRDIKKGKVTLPHKLLKVTYDVGDDSEYFRWARIGWPEPGKMESEYGKKYQGLFDRMRPSILAAVRHFARMYKSDDYAMSLELFYRRHEEHVLKLGRTPLRNVPFGLNPLYMDQGMALVHCRPGAYGLLDILMEASEDIWPIGKASGYSCMRVAALFAWMQFNSEDLPMMFIGNFDTHFNPPTTPKIQLGYAVSPVLHGVFTKHVPRLIKHMLGHAFLSFMSFIGKIQLIIDLDNIAFGMAPPAVTREFLLSVVHRMIKHGTKVMLVGKYSVRSHCEFYEYARDATIHLLNRFSDRRRFYLVFPLTQIIDIDVPVFRETHNLVVETSMTPNFPVTRGQEIFTNYRPERIKFVHPYRYKGEVILRTGGCAYGNLSSAFKQHCMSSKQDILAVLATLNDHDDTSVLLGVVSLGATGKPRDFWKQDHVVSTDKPLYVMKIEIFTEDHGTAYRPHVKLIRVKHEVVKVEESVESLALAEQMELFDGLRVAKNYHPWRFIQPKHFTMLEVVYEYHAVMYLLNNWEVVKQHLPYDGSETYPLMGKFSEKEAEKIVWKEWMDICPMQITTGQWYLRNGIWNALVDKRKEQFGDVLKPNMFGFVVMSGDDFFPLNLDGNPKKITLQQYESLFQKIRGRVKGVDTLDNAMIFTKGELPDAMAEEEEGEEELDMEE